LMVANNAPSRFMAPCALHYRSARGLAASLR
jgi:hypothetical protein